MAKQTARRTSARLGKKKSTSGGRSNGIEKRGRLMERQCKTRALESSAKECEKKEAAKLVKENGKRKRSSWEKELRATFKEKTVSKVEMKCALVERADHDESLWPATTDYKPIRSNVIGEGLAMSVLEAGLMAQEAKHKVCCSCHDRNEKCSTSASCECRQFGDNLKSAGLGSILQVNRMIPPTSEQNDFYKKTFVVCGPECSCRGKCEFDVLSTLEENEKIVRREGEKGFALFTRHAVKKGHPVVAFTGELCGPTTVTGDAESWSLLLAGDEGSQESHVEEWFAAAELKAPAPSYRSRLKAAFDCKVFINPLKKGNCARFMSHSCDPNTQLRRVFRNGISPTNMVVMMFATKNLSAGAELTFDYGAFYMSAHMPVCLCEACTNQHLRTKKKKKVVTAQAHPRPQKSRSTTPTLNKKKKNAQEKSTKSKSSVKTRKAPSKSPPKTTSRSLRASTTRKRTY